MGVNRSNCGLTRALVAVVGQLFFIQLHPDEDFEVFADLSRLDRNGLGRLVDIADMVAVALEFEIEGESLTGKDILFVIGDRDEVGNLCFP